MTATIHRLVRIALIGLLVPTTSACLISIGGYGVSAEILGGPETVFVIHVGESG